uniref:Uncharacterized protein n=1 Tax=Mustela putorius furo TaxID=9669 RepID=M3YBA0_MUSPF
MQSACFQIRSHPEVPGGHDFWGDAVELLTLSPLWDEMPVAQGPGRAWEGTPGSAPSTMPVRRARMRGPSQPRRAQRPFPSSTLLAAGGQLRVTWARRSGNTASSAVPGGQSWSDRDRWGQSSQSQGRGAGCGVWGAGGSAHPEWPRTP